MEPGHERTRPRLRGMKHALGLRFWIVLVVTVGWIASGACGPSDVPSGERPTHGQQPQGSSDLERALASLAPNGAVALVRTDTGIRRAASGDAEPGRPADPHDRFHIGSTTKTFVATVVLQLVGERRLSLRDTVEDILPRELKAGRRITVRELLNHSSGLIDRTGPGPLLAFPPGTRHWYSNANYVVLGRIVEEVTGRPLDQVVLERIFRPLHLDDTSYGGSATRPDEDGIAWLGDPHPLEGPVSGSGGIMSTAYDVSTFFAALMGGELLGPDLLSQMTRTIDAGEGVRAGLGIFEFELSCGPAWGHGGDDLSTSVMPLAAPDGSRVVVVAQDATGWTAAKAVAEEIYCS
jgi:D-alanyl-D-alanine carboxypeptidase